MKKKRKVRQGERFSFSSVFFSYYCFHFLLLFFIFIAGELYASQHTISTNIVGKSQNLLDVRSGACAVKWFSSVR